METLIPKFVDISEWNKIPYSSTGGTRAKNIYVFPKDDKEYFFKGSKKISDGRYKYPTEFWSEIVASKIGQMLGFNLLNYDIGYDLNDEQKIGCISQSMVEHTENKLSEGVDFLRGFDSSYNPKTDETRYTLDFIKRTLVFFDLSEFEPNFIEMLIFDAIIGNSDRHQENWGFISKFRETILDIDEEIVSTRGFIARLEPKFRKFMAKITLKQRELQDENFAPPTKSILKTQSQFVETVFSPIYDSGCCLGRELEDTKIDLMLKDPQMLEAFIIRGRSEIRFNIGQKPKHFDFLKDIRNYDPEVFNAVVEKVKFNFDSSKLNSLIHSIDSNLPIELKRFSLPDNRKLLMYNLVALRIEKILKLNE